MKTYQEWVSHPRRVFSKTPYDGLSCNLPPDNTRSGRFVTAEEDERAWCDNDSPAALQEEHVSDRRSPFSWSHDPSEDAASVFDAPTFEQDLEDSLSQQRLQCMMMRVLMQPALLAVVLGPGDLESSQSMTGSSDGRGSEGAHGKIYGCTEAVPPTVGQIANIRMLIFEASTLVVAQLRAQATADDTDLTGRKLPHVEKQARLAAQKARLPGLLIEGELQPSYALVDACALMSESNSVTWISPSRCTKRGAEVQQLGKERTSLVQIEAGTLKVSASSKVPDAASRIGSPSEHASLSQRRSYISHLACVADDRTVQAKLPQVLLGNKHQFTLNFLRSIAGKIRSREVQMERPKGDWRRAFLRIWSNEQPTPDAVMSIFPSRWKVNVLSYVLWQPKSQRAMGREESSCTLGFSRLPYLLVLVMIDALMHEIEKNTFGLTGRPWLLSRLCQSPTVGSQASVIATKTILSCEDHPALAMVAVGSAEANKDSDGL
ncbi:unnamed protein product [Symbiodinium microadriaticum]|nr:unnamed protein product [Symbiodinium microadriaticum]